MCPAIQAIRNESHAAGMIAGMATGRAEGIVAGRAEGMATGRISMLYDLVKDGTFSVFEAANRANMSVAEFQQKVQALAL